MALVPFPAWLAVVARHGQGGVAFFFLLSGFILTYNYQQVFVLEGRRAAPNFYRARFARIYPLHLLALLLATPLTLAIHRATLAADWPLLAGSWLAHLLALQAWVPVKAIQHFYDAPSWSISAEFFFYLVFPLAIAPLARLRDRPRILLLLSAALLAGETLAAIATHEAVVGLIAADPAVASWLDPRWSAIMWAGLRLPEFLIGCALGTWFLGRDAAKPVSGALLPAGLGVAYALCWVPAGAGGVAFEVAREHVAFTVPFAAVIVGLAAGQGRLQALLAAPALVLLGEVSFALYLLHDPVRILQMYLYRPTTPLGWLTGIACALVLSVACHLWVERPARRWVRARGQGAAA
jgi:peptidoglycan/LPS O-acetylase OafA/YrhL